MRENRTYGSEGGEGQLFPTPIGKSERTALRGVCDDEMAGEDARPPRNYSTLVR